MGAVCNIKFDDGKGEPGLTRCITAKKHLANRKVTTLRNYGGHFDRYINVKIGNLLIAVLRRRAIR